ncbi:MAG: response regulator [Bdellovibrionales bacterium]|nr:response regulator [Bdellovibrionales bacterium]
MGTGAENQKQQVLVIEDVELNRRLLNLILSSSGYELHEAENGAEALRVLESYTPDVIICDLYMPEMNGEEFLIAASQSESLQHIPIIMLSAEADEEIEKRFLALGAKAVLQKDGKYTNLKLCLSELLP